MDKSNITPKIVATDWDGTFSEQGGKPRIEALNAKNLLLSRKILVVLISGRSIKEVLKYVKDYELSSTFVAELGTVLYHDGNEIINHGDLREYKESSLHNEFINLIDKQKINAHDAIFKIGAVDAVLTTANKHKMKLRIFTPKDGRPGEKENNIMEKKGTVLLRGNAETDILNEFLNKKTSFLEVKDNGLVEDNSGEHAYHLLIKGANKDSAMVLLQKLLKVDSNESVALGDSLSDLALALVVGRFYLMRNGISHTPDMLERFKKTLTPENKDEIMHRIKITRKDAGLGWTEAIDEILNNQKD